MSRNRLSEGRAVMAKNSDVRQCSGFTTPVAPAYNLYLIYKRVYFGATTRNLK